MSPARARAFQFALEIGLIEMFSALERAANRPPRLYARAQCPHAVGAFRERCPQRAELRVGEPPTSRGLAVGILQVKKCDWGPEVSVIFRCTTHGWTEVWHPEGDRYVKCHRCWVVPRLKLELKPRRAIEDGARPPSIHDGYPFVIA